MILVTGATGFVGRAVVARLEKERHGVRAATRQATSSLPRSVEQVEGCDLTSDANWSRALTGVDAAVHLAGLAHVARGAGRRDAARFEAVNVAGTLRLANAAATAGVRRFLFMSSIKVNGERTVPGRPFRDGDEAAPEDLYGESKYRAEVGLRAIATQTGMEVVIIRPVLVYGPGAKGNILSLLHWIARGLPLPLGGLHNRRSMVALDNLADLVALCAVDERAANQTLLVSDGEDLSTTDLVRRLAVSLGRRARLVSVPPPLVTGMARLAGRGDIADKLLGSLQVDITRTKTLLQWQPPVTVDEAMRGTAAWFAGTRTVLA